MKQDEISIVIPIKGDSKNLEELLSNLKFFKFNDIHVVDSVQDEINISLCGSFSAKYTVFNWDGEFPKKRNWYLNNNTLRDWVLFLDADERLTQEFCEELRNRNDDKYDAFLIKYNNTFLDKKLRYGDVMAKIPLFRKHIRFEKIDESGWSVFDMEIHEHPIVEKFKLGVFKSRIEHLEKTNIEKYLLKHNHYSNWESRRLAQDNILIDLRPRIKLKYLLLKSPFLGVFYFIYAFVFKLGFLDGWSGYYLARLKSQYFFWIRLKYKYETSK